MANLPQNKQEIERCLPHADKMVLIDSVRECTEESLLCEANTHRAEDNPLRCDNKLSVFAGVEYAAQAMALHSYLSQRAHNQSEKSVNQGFVAVVSSVTAHVRQLSDVAAPLRIGIEKVDSSGGGSLYSFQLRNAITSAPVLEGRLLVMLQQLKE